MADKKSIRPSIPSAQVKKQMSEEEKFQNAVIRPIIKLQHHLLFLFLKGYFTKNKIVLPHHSETEAVKNIETLFAKNKSFRVELRGFVIGLFTEEEYEEYLPLSSELNKRIHQMIKERVLSQLDFFTT